jgi:beta-lactamase superfamily II metal-dependent hydrolase
MRRLRPTVFISVWLLMLAAAEHEAGLGCHATLLVADPPARVTAPPHAGVRVMYLGTNAYLLEARDATLLRRSYFSRMSSLRATLNLRAASEQSVIARHLGNRRIEAMLATHGHFDHLLDVPEIMNRSGAKLIASPTSVLLGRSVRRRVSALQAVTEWRSSCTWTAPRCGCSRRNTIGSSDECHLMGHCANCRRAGQGIGFAVNRSHF